MPPSEAFTIRQATLSDKDRVTAQQIDSQNEEARLHPSRMEGGVISGVAWEMIHSGGGFILIAEKNGELIGHVGGSITRQPSPFFKAQWHEYAMIFDLYVTPAHRRQGIARALVKQMMQVLASRGANHVRIVGLSNNQAALALYRALGFSDYEITLERGLAPAGKLR